MVDVQKDTMISLQMRLSRIYLWAVMMIMMLAMGCTSMATIDTKAIDVSMTNAQPFGLHCQSSVGFFMDYDDIKQCYFFLSMHQDGHFHFKGLRDHIVDIMSDLDQQSTQNPHKAQSYLFITIKAAQYVTKDQLKKIRRSKFDDDLSAISIGSRGKQTDTFVVVIDMQISSKIRAKRGNRFKRHKNRIVMAGSKPDPVAFAQRFEALAVSLIQLKRQAS